MAIRYTCRHCETEIGTLPFESVKETVLLAAEDGRRGS